MPHKLIEANPYSAIKISDQVGISKMRNYILPNLKLSF